MNTDDTQGGSLEALGNFLSDPFRKKKGLRDKLRGKVHYGSFEKNPNVIVRYNADETKDYGRFNDGGDFVLFTKDELRSFSLSYGVDLQGTGTVLPFKKKERKT